MRRLNAPAFGLRPSAGKAGLLPNAPAFGLYAVVAALSLGLSACSYFFPSCQTIPDCPAGQALCTNASCADLTNDPQNCGSCNNVCAPGLVCIPGPEVADAGPDGGPGPGPGSCGCPNGLLLSNGQCLDLATDSHNCGSVGATCPGGQVCLARQCRCVGADGGTNLETDDLNCGTCGVACAATATCQAGACICQDGTAQCGAACCGDDGPCEAGLCAGASDGGTDAGAEDGGLTDAGPADAGVADGGDAGGDGG
jgi:hypothetical protein